MKQSKREALFVLITWASIFACAWLAAEIYLRWHYFNLPMDDAHLPHPYLQTILNPAYPLKPGESLEKIGRFGLRKSGESLADRAQYKILALGDSCTFSVASSNEANSFPSLLESKIAQAGGPITEVYNAGVPGYNSLQMFLYLSLLLKEIQPDEIVIYGGWNDVNVILHDRGALYIENNANGLPKMYRQRTYWELAEKIPNGLDRWLSNSLLYDQIRFKLNAFFTKREITSFWMEKGVTSMPEPPLIIPEITANFKNNLTNIIALAKGRGIEVSLVTLATPMRKRYDTQYLQLFMHEFGNDASNFLRLTPAELFYYIESFNQIIREIARTNQVTLYDWDRWVQENPDLTLFEDVLHPSDKGYQVLVDKIMEQRALSRFAVPLP